MTPDPAKGREALGLNFRGPGKAEGQEPGLLDSAEGGGIDAALLCLREEGTGDLNSKVVEVTEAGEDTMCRMCRSGGYGVELLKGRQWLPCDSPPSRTSGAGEQWSCTLHGGFGRKDRLALQTRKGKGPWIQFPAPSLPGPGSLHP